MNPEFMTQIGSGAALAEVGPTRRHASLAPSKP